MLLDEQRRPVPDGEVGEICTRPRPVALVHRGPASLPGCPEAVAALPRSSRWRFGVVGPRPEATEDRYTGARLAVADPLGIDLGPDPVDAVMSP